MKVTAKINGTTPWWTAGPERAAFEAARAALKASFGTETAMVGAGGTIGFAEPFADLLQGAPCILMSVADPNTQAHSDRFPGIACGTAAKTLDEALGAGAPISEPVRANAPAAHHLIELRTHRSIRAPSARSSTTSRCQTTRSRCRSGPGRRDAATGRRGDEGSCGVPRGDG